MLCGMLTKRALISAIASQVMVLIVDTCQDFVKETSNCWNSPWEFHIHRGAVSASNLSNSLIGSFLACYRC